MKHKGSDPDRKVGLPTHPSTEGGAKPLPRLFFERGAEEVARDLLGCRLISEIGGIEVGGRIVETEAYIGPQDPASHAAAHIGRTARNDPMFGPPGTAYVYFIYGMHWCFNVVTSAPGDPQAVLIRALEPEIGVPTIRERRGGSRELTNGPGRMAKALAIDGSMNGHWLTDPPLQLVRGERGQGEAIGVSGRIGIRAAQEWPLRFFLAGNLYLSR